MKTRQFAHALTLFASLTNASFLLANQADETSEPSEPAASQRVETVTEQINIPVGKQGKQDIKLPERGLSRQSVLQNFGVPAFWQDDVGKPPITHWRYKDYSVYFENNRVIHTVVHKQVEQITEQAIEQASSEGAGESETETATEEPLDLGNLQSAQ